MAVWLCFLLLVPVIPMRSSAVQAKAQKGFNIMIVMDCSGSLVNGTSPSDLHGYRHEATSMFLDLLSENENNVGAIVFNGTTSTTDSSEASMRTGLRLNTGLLPMTNKTDRSNLMKQIRSISPGGFTDIGTALLEAANQLKGKKVENGKESIIVLFTDGETETKDKQKDPTLPDAELPVYSQSKKNRDAAVELIRQEGITLCGVYLSAETVDPEQNEVLRLVRSANGYDEFANQEQVGDRFIHVKEASTLTDAYQRFFTLVSGTGAEPFEKEKQFRIPGTGIKEVNISIGVKEASLEKCRKALDNLNVTILRPGNKEYTNREMADIMYRGSNYAIFKIRDPEVGLWKIQIECPGAEVDSSILFSTTVSAEASFSVAAGDIQINKPFTATAKLTQNGMPLAAAEDYQEYDGVLLVQNADTLEEWPVALSYDQSANAYTGQLYIQQYGEYYIHAEFTCGDTVRIVTPIQYWNIVNHLPEAPESREVPITVSLLAPGTAQIDLAELVQDREDDVKNIGITLDAGDYSKEAYTMEGSVLTVDGAIGGSGKMTVVFTDTAGGKTETEIRINVTNYLERDMRLLQIGGILIVVLILVIAFLKWKRKRLGGNLPGVLNMTLLLNGSVMVPLTVHAQNVVNQNLYNVLKENHSILLDNAMDRRCSEDDVDQFLSRYRKGLSEIYFTAIENKKTGQSICRVEGLSTAEGQTDLSHQRRIELRFPSGPSGINIVYDRYQ